MRIPRLRRGNVAPKDHDRRRSKRCGRMMQATLRKDRQPGTLQYGAGLTKTLGFDDLRSRQRRAMLGGKLGDRISFGLKVGRQGTPAIPSPVFVGTRLRLERGLQKNPARISTPDSPFFVGQINLAQWTNPLAPNPSSERLTCDVITLTRGIHQCLYLPPIADRGKPWIVLPHGTPTGASALIQHPDG